MLVLEMILGDASNLQGLAIFTLCLFVVAGALMTTVIRRYRADTKDERIGWLRVEAADRAAEENRNAEALACLREAAAIAPAITNQPDYLERLAIHSTNAGNGEEAIAAIRRFRSLRGSSKITFALVADIICTAALTSRWESLYAEAEELIRDAIAVLPDERTLQGTLGSLLVETGRDAEAKPLLEGLHQRSDNATDTGIAAAYLSTLAARRGDTAESAKYRREALDTLPDHALVRRVLGIDRVAET